MAFWAFLACPLFIHFYPPLVLPVAGRVRSEQGRVKSEVTLCCAVSSRAEITPRVPLASHVTRTRRRVCRTSALPAPPTSCSLSPASPGSREYNTSITNGVSKSSTATLQRQKFCLLLFKSPHCTVPSAGLPIHYHFVCM